MASSGLLLTASACTKTVDPVSDGGGGGSAIVTSHEVGGVISVDTTWSIEQCPVTVVEDVYVEGPSGPTLTIAPGCTVNFKKDCGIYVGKSGGHGALNAVGTTAPILFTVDDTSKPDHLQPGYWSGISFSAATINDNDSTTNLPKTHLQNVVVEYAGGYFLNGGIDVEGTQPFIESTTVRYSGKHGFYFHNKGGFSTNSTAPSSKFTVNTNAGYGIYIDAEMASTIPLDGTFVTLARAIGIPGATISDPTTWPDPGQPYTILDNLYVEGPTTPSLTLQPGVHANFLPDKGLYVGARAQPGKLFVSGSAPTNESQGNGLVRLDGIGGTSQARGSWSGIELGPYGGGSVLTNLAVTHAGGAQLLGCIDVENLITDEQRPLMTNVQVDTCDDYGFYFGSSSGFAPGSGYVSATNSTLYGMYIEAEPASTIPAVISGATQYLALHNGQPGGCVGSCEVEVPGGTITDDTTWNDIGSPYTITKDINVGSKNEPVFKMTTGVRVEFLDSKGLYVGNNGLPGSLDLEGGEAVAPDTTPLVSISGHTKMPGSWSGIVLGDATVDARGDVSNRVPVTKLVNTLIEYGGENRNAIIDTTVNDAVHNPKRYFVDHLTVQHGSGYGLRLTNGTALFPGSQVLRVLDNQKTGVYSMSAAVSTLPTDLNGDDANVSDYTTNYLGAVEVGGYSVNQPFSDLCLPGDTVKRTWFNLNDAYIISGEIYVDYCSLDISPGTKLKFTKDRGIYVAFDQSGGAFSAKGTTTYPILFTANDSAPTRGEWAGISYYATATDADCTLDNTQIEYAGGQGTNGTLNGNVVTNDASPLIQNSTIWKGERCGVYSVCSVAGDTLNTPRFNNDNWGYSSTASLIGNIGGACDSGCNVPEPTACDFTTSPQKICAKNLTCYNNVCTACDATRICNTNFTCMAAECHQICNLTPDSKGVKNICQNGLQCSTTAGPGICPVVEN